MNNIEQIINTHSSATREELIELHSAATLHGRIHSIRLHRNTSFYNVFWDGHTIQMVLNQNTQNYAQLVESLSVGDVIEIEGHVSRTLRGELSIVATLVNLISHCEHNITIVRNQPNNFSYAQRDQEMICNPSLLERFRTRALAIQHIREFMYQRNFLELDTPLLHEAACGAQARTFDTYFEARNQNIHLRVAPETFLVRAVAAGYSQIFELGRNFRNEGVSSRHQPEFSMMEAYRSFTDWVWAMDFVELLINSLYARFSPQNLNFQRLTIPEFLVQQGLSLSEIENREYLISRVGQRHAAENIDMLQYYLFELYESSIIEPIFILRQPQSISPLAYCDEHGTQRFELFMNGIEIANGFTQLINPSHQRDRFVNQSGEEQMAGDNMYLESMTYGFPSIGGFGIGVDRIIMALTGCSDIRDVVMFPHTT